MHTHIDASAERLGAADPHPRWAIDATPRSLMQWLSPIAARNCRFGADIVQFIRCAETSDSNFLQRGDVRFIAFTAREFDPRSFRSVLLRIDRQRLMRPSIGNCLQLVVHILDENVMDRKCGFVFFHGNVYVPYVTNGKRKRPYLLRLDWLDGAYRLSACANNAGRELYPDSLYVAQER